ncbi:MAG TPA: hypothetical protein VGI13_07525, partial [Candidatus Acidoferrum sp.]
SRNGLVRQSVSIWRAKYGPIELDSDLRPRNVLGTGGLTMADINEVVVRGNAAGFAQEILAGRHRLTADEPVADGGTDTGPTPYDLLLAALGS